MAKTKTAFVCTECGADYSKWQGQCTACQAWNTISEVRGVSSNSKGARGARFEGFAGSLSEVQSLDDVSLAELSDTEHPQGVLCICTEPGLDLVQLRNRAPSTLLLLDGLQDPGNMGTLIRAARAFGVDAVIVLDGSVDPWNAKAVRAAAGASFHTHIARAPWAEARPWLEEQHIEILAADPAGDDVRSFQVRGSWALAVGNEGAGLRADIAAASTKRIAIPMPGKAESLNAGVAGSILLYSLLTR